MASSLLKGRVTFRRFRVIGEPPAVNGEEFLEALRDHAFQEITNRTDVDEEMGWIGPDHLFDKEFTTAKLVHDPYVILSVRHDKRRVPRAILQAWCQVEERAWREATSKEKVPPRKKREIRESVEERLRRETPPTSQMIHAFWNVRDRMLYLCNRSRAVAESFADLFRMTFNLELEPVGPFTLGAELLDEDGVARLVETEPTRFALQTG